MTTTKTTTTINSYKAHSGVTYTQEAYDNSHLYSPSERREIDSHNAVYFAAINSDKLKMRQDQDAKQAERARPLTEQEYYEQAVIEDERKKAVVAELVAAEVAKTKAHEKFLKSSPEYVFIVESTPSTFIANFKHWILKGYTEIEGTLVFNFPMLFTVNMVRGNAQ